MALRREMPARRVLHPALLVSAVLVFGVGIVLSIAGHRLGTLCTGVGASGIGIALLEIGDPLQQWLVTLLGGVITARPRFQSGRVRSVGRAFLVLGILFCIVGIVELVG